MAKKKKSSRQESPEDAAERLEREELARVHAEARREVVQRRILAADEMAANRTKLRLLSSSAVATGSVEIFPQLPIEIRRQIFKQLTDTDSLHSLISASRSFHECYIDDQYQCEVFCKMLVDEMTLPIFLRAVAISSDSVRRIRWTGQWTGAFQNVREFMDEYSTDSRATTYDGRSYDMGTLLSIAEFHLIIKAVTRDFFESCLNLHPWTHKKYEKNELGRLEELRIQRAFYNLELYVRLFERGDHYLIERTTLNERLHGIIWGRRNAAREIYGSFFNYFSFWEIEEIVSAKDYMEREYNDIINECKDFLAKNSQAQQYGSPSTLKKIHEAGSIKLGSCDHFRKHYNDFNRTFINKGVEFFWMWSYSLPGPRVVQLYWVEGKCWSDGEQPVALHFSQESRETALKVYKLAFKSKLSLATTYFDYIDARVFTDYSMDIIISSFKETGREFLPWMVENNGIVMPWKVLLGRATWEARISEIWRFIELHDPTVATLRIFAVEKLERDLKWEFRNKYLNGFIYFDDINCLLYATEELGRLLKLRDNEYETYHKFGRWLAQSFYHSKTFERLRMIDAEAYVDPIGW
ncbi:hypothetical protein BHYA_0053g00220 [Botrytis hyacinthi]|uniref:2EXR domain-containing protein n=1 Tax=Botrytis hyacinthi TaxID=278943 RepID=A0A4Z1H211_9HELO|nr:hypothetical protein BHYA_0053g00220 [Botrytis hyacinthi]